MCPRNLITGTIIAELFGVEGLVHTAGAEPEKVGEGNAVELPWRRLDRQHAERVGRVTFSSSSFCAKGSRVHEPVRWFL